MKLDSLLVAVVIVSMFAGGFGLLISNLATTYNVPIDESMTSKFGSLNSTYSLTNQSINDLKAASTRGESNSFDIVEALKASINVVKTVFVEGIPNVLLMVTGLGDYIPLPPFIIRGIQSIVIILIGFALVYLFLRYKNE